MAATVTASTMYVLRTVAEISRLKAQDLETPISASITDIKPLSSYHWIEAPHATPTIAVAGRPALW